jgi:glucosamine-6-phosphate deaminase
MRNLNWGSKEQPVPVSIYSDAQKLGSALAELILRGLQEASKAKKRYLLGCPGGRSLQSTYRALARLAAEAKADLSGLVIVMMDDYVLPKGQGFVHCPEDAHYSCRRFGREDIWKVLNAGLEPGKRIPESQLWIPDPADPLEYEKRLEGAGGIDLFLLASGASDGHVAFNPPGSALDSLTRIIPLAASTRRDNLGTFPEFKGLDDVPGHGVSVGVGSIVRHSRFAALAIHGKHKQGAAKKLAGLKAFSPDWPVSLIYACKKAAIFLDEEAAALL